MRFVEAKSGFHVLLSEDGDCGAGWDEKVGWTACFGE